MSDHTGRFNGQGKRVLVTGASPGIGAEIATLLADVGGLLTYGASLREVLRRVAVFVDKILQGRKPEELPIDQIMRLELVINLKTAQALGITMPPSLLLLADEVIQ